MSVSLSDTDDSTPLHSSAQLGHLEATKILVEDGAVLNYTNIGYNNALVLAA